LKNKKIISINNSRFVYCRFPSNGIPKNYNENVRFLINSKYVPIITNFNYCPLSEDKKVINELFEIGCLFDIDLYDYFEFGNRHSTNVIKYMEEQGSIITFSGINRLTDINKAFLRLNRQSKINLDKIIEYYCWKNPNLIISN
tara:strand:- start:88 stop:516 length:429 start_codon:yes stop_codon:yes gene_type:complete